VTRNGSRRRNTPAGSSVVGAALRFGALPGSAIHLCVDMQTMFAERTDWHVPWMERVLPFVARIAGAHPDRTIFTRFVPWPNAEQAPGAWQRYYQRWQHMTLEKLDPRLIQLVPPLAELAPPALVFDKHHYSPFAEPLLHEVLRDRGSDTLVITGGETDVCVLASVLGAVDAGYRVILASDALCSVSDRTHDALLQLYRERFSQQIEIAFTDEILESWR
jgi:nicotinamidase-related amidase